MPKTNVLLIVTDEQRYDCLGVAGNRQIQTPHLDALAKDSVHFTHSFCPFAVCTPSRYSMMSGLYVHQHRGRSNKSTPGSGIQMFPSMMRLNGYCTKAIGKMHFHPTYLDVGFRYMILAEQAGDGRMEDQYHRELRREGLIDLIDVIDQRPEFRRRAPRNYWENFGAEISNLPEKWHSTSWIGRQTLEHLERWEDEGHMMMVSFIKPHHPFDPPREWAEKYDIDSIEPLPGWTDETPAHDLAFHPGFFPHKDLTEERIRRVTAYYYATISHIDFQVGRMIETLKRKGQYDNTMIIFTSDHGDYMGFHHMLLKQNYYYDPVVRVPLLIKFPQNARGGEVCDALVNNIDLAPTVLAHAGVRAPSYLPGMDLSDPHADREFIFSEFEAYQRKMFMARSRRYKLMFCADSSMSQFIDLEKDPYELDNRINDPAMQDEIQRHKEALARWQLFEAQVPSCSNAHAPCLRVLSQPGLPELGQDAREDMLEYFEGKAGPFLATAS